MLKRYWTVLLIPLVIGVSACANDNRNTGQHRIMPSTEGATETQANEHDAPVSAEEQPGAPGPSAVSDIGTTEDTGTDVKREDAPGGKIKARSNPR